MARTITLLTDAKIKRAKPKDKQYTLTSGVYCCRQFPLNIIT